MSDTTTAETNKAVLRGFEETVNSGNLGEYMVRPPTGKRVTYDEMFILRFVDGRVAETWGVVDVLSQLTQLGVVEL